MNYEKIKSYEDACKVLGLKPTSDEVFNVFGQDNVKDKDGDKGFAVTFGVAGSRNVLARALARFFQHKESKEIVKSAQLRVKFDGMFEDFMGAIKDIIND